MQHIVGYHIQFQVTYHALNALPRTPGDALDHRHPRPISSSQAPAPWQPRSVLRWSWRHPGAYRRSSTRCRTTSTTTTRTPTGTIPTSEETDAVIASSRAALADFLGASPSEIVFGANMTTLTFHLARALGRSWGPGDEIVITELDHHANVAPWTALARERGVTIRTVPLLLETGQLDWEALDVRSRRRPDSWRSGRHRTPSAR